MHSRLGAGAHLVELCCYLLRKLSKFLIILRISTENIRILSDVSRFDHIFLTTSGHKRTVVEGNKHSSPGQSLHFTKRFSLFIATHILYLMTCSSHLDVYSLPYPKNLRTHRPIRKLFSHVRKYCFRSD